MNERQEKQDNVLGLVAKVGKGSLFHLIEDHKRICSKSLCDVSLIMIMLWIENLGYEFTEEEKELFA